MQIKTENENSLISIRTQAGRLVVLGAVDVGAVRKCAVALANRASALLVGKVPVEAGEWPVLRALVLQKLRALLRTKLFQIAYRAATMNNVVNEYRPTAKRRLT